ncbi:uncharacterized protein LOC144322204 [Canis aureus]
MWKEISSRLVSCSAGLSSQNMVSKLCSWELLLRFNIIFRNYLARMWKALKTEIDEEAYPSKQNFTFVYFVLNGVGTITHYKIFNFPRTVTVQRILGINLHMSSTYN